MRRSKFRRPCKVLIFNGARVLVVESLSLIPHEGIEVEVSIEPEDTMLYADRALMSQVMLNATVWG